MLLGFLAAGITMTGPASAQLAQTCGAYMSRAHSVLVASRVHCILV
jgi:hypothetical protein